MKAFPFHRLKFAVVLILLLGGSLYGLNHFATATITEVYERKDLGDYPPLSSLNRRIINIIFLGQSALYDDFIHLWTTQYLTKPEILKKDPKELEVILRRIASLEIRSPYFYQISCFRFIFDFKTPWLCEDIAKMGLEVAPESWLIGAILGFAYMEQESYVEAAAMFARTSHLKDAPKYLKTVGSTLLYKKGVSQRILQTILEDESSKHILKQLQEGLAEKQDRSIELPPLANYTVELPEDTDEDITTNTESEDLTDITLNKELADKKNTNVSQRHSLNAEAAEEKTHSDKNTQNTQEEDITDEP